MDKNISQEKLAELAGLTPAHVSHIETGNTKGSLPTMVNIANSLEISIDDLLCDSVTRSKHVFSRELEELLSDCSDSETLAIVEVAKATKLAVRQVAKNIKKES